MHTADNLYETELLVKWYVRACAVCHGDLHDDIEMPGFARCLMCGRAFEIARAAFAGRRGTGPKRLSAPEICQLATASDEPPDAPPLARSA